ncbi:TPA: replication factor C large subunit [Candidatus Woesearchaeota archaeon]|nr:replication factor C large subunit [Candidatus Woesearchaeota archaeon]HII89352.1 replication factor C large subunit [Candidatus Woesearchaeota archaeon]
MSWAHTYKPKSLNDFMGQTEIAIATLKTAVQSFKKGSKALLLHGPSGSGKTSSVHALAKDLNYEILEINASDTRNKEAIHTILGAATQQQSLFYRGKLILLDEIDGLSGTDDRGCLSELSALLQESSFPVICTMVDPEDEKLKPIKKQCQLIEFPALDPKIIAHLLKAICDKEHIPYDENALASLSRSAGGDMRAAITDLQVATSVLLDGKKLSKADLSVLGGRETKTQIEEALMRVFKTLDPAIALEAFDQLALDYNEALLWLDENLPREYEKPADRARAYDFLSRADIMNRRIRRWQHWRFLVYIQAYLSAGVAVAKDEKYKPTLSYRQTHRLLRIWQANMKFSHRKSIAQKLSSVLHLSSARAVREVIPYLQLLCKHDACFAEKLGQELKLEIDEVGWLQASM